MSAKEFFRKLFDHKNSFSLSEKLFLSHLTLSLLSELSYILNWGLSYPLASDILSAPLIGFIENTVVTFWGDKISLDNSLPFFKYIGDAAQIISYFKRFYFIFTASFEHQWVGVTIETIFIPHIQKDLKQPAATEHCGVGSQSNQASTKIKSAFIRKKFYLNKIWRFLLNKFHSKQVILVEIHLIEDLLFFCHEFFLESFQSHYGSFLSTHHNSSSRWLLSEFPVKWIAKKLGNCSECFILIIFFFNIKKKLHITWKYVPGNLVFHLTLNFYHFQTELFCKNYFTSPEVNCFSAMLADINEFIFSSWNWKICYWRVELKFSHSVKVKFVERTLDI